MSKITHIGRNFSDMNSGSKKLRELFPGLALPLAAGINEGGHYFAYFSSFLLFVPPLFKTTEGVVVLFQICAWAPKKK